MQAGRELDALIADKIFGNTRHGVDINYLSESNCSECHKLHRFDEEALPYYSTDIKAAWEVVEKLRDDNFYIEENGTHWKVGFGTHWAGSESASHAICLAALKV